MHVHQHVAVEGPVAGGVSGEIEGHLAAGRDVDRMLEGLVTGGPAGHQPLKHTVNVAPGGKVTFDLTADAPGDWAFHCHMLMHMHAGMFNVVTVRPMDGAAS